MPSTTSVVAALGFAAQVSAHGYLTNAFIGGTKYFVGSPNWIYPGQNPASQPGWYAYNQDSGFISPSAYSTPDIICHKDATPGNSFLSVPAGSTIGLQWNTWPDGHHGPVMNQMAAVSGDFSAVDKTTLNFFAVQNNGWVSGSNPGLWATDTLIANNLTGELTIPASLAPGNYILRHEIISLHAANNAGGAQNYPMCVNVKITGSGSKTPCASGADCRVGEKLYSPTDPGINFNLYQAFSSYQIPGPSVWSGFAGGAGSTPTTMATSTKAPVTSTTFVPTPPPSSTSRSVTSSASSACTITITRSKTSSSAASTSTSTSSAVSTGGACASKYGQCGGTGWSGPTCCAAGSKCTVSNQYYSQCL